MKILLIPFLALFLASQLLGQNPAPSPSPVPATSPSLPQPTVTPASDPSTAKEISLSFPKTSIFDILTFYESLTGKRIIRDPNLTGQDLSIMVKDPVSRQDAIKLIESSLLIGNYSIVPVDEKTIKVLGPSRPPRTEGLPLYNDIRILPNGGDQVVSFYKPLRFLSPEEAITVLMQVVQINPQFGGIAPVPNTNAIILTDKTPVIRTALDVISLIDVEPARVVTESVQLQRANAERVVEILDEMFGKDDKTKPGTTAAPQPTNPEGPPAPTLGLGGARYENRLIAGKAKFFADKRTNRILVIARAGDDYRYVRDVIDQLDAAGTSDQPYVRPLNYVSAGDIFPTLSDMLSNPESEKKGGAAQPQATPANQFSNNSSQRGNTRNSSSGSNSGSDHSDRISDESGQTAPQSVTLGEIHLIADNSSNSIIVFGPPESKQRAKQILDLLDISPKQVYLAVIIGQLRVGNDMEYGVNYLIHYKNFQPLQSLLGNSNSNGGAISALSPNLFNALPVPSGLTNAAAFAPLLSGLSGLTIFGTIADSVDVYAKFLESTNRFRVLHRPVIYTKNNQKATILSGQKIPIATSTLTQPLSGGVTNSTAFTSNIQYQDVILKLEVKPLINSDREVNLTIAQTNDNIIGTQTVSGNSYPIINTQEITTSVRVPNKSTIVLGGLVTEEKTNDQEGLPYISRIPILGSLLGGRTNNKKEKRELIIMIQPVVVDSNDEMMKASAYEGDRTPLGQDAQALAAPLAEQAHEPAPWKPTPTPTPKAKKKKLFQ